MRYFEDVAVGETLALGSHTVSEEEILAFGRRYDPQPMHADPAAARQGFYGGLIASGWHTCAVMMRLTAQTIARTEEASAGAPGVESCRWRTPVRPGDTLTGSSEVLAAWPSRSKPVGFVRRRSELVNQRGEAVVTLVGVAMVRRRDARGPA